MLHLHARVPQFFESNCARTYVTLGILPDDNMAFTLQKREQYSCPDESGRAHAAQGFSAQAERFLAVRSFRNTTS